MVGKRCRNFKSSPFKRQVEAAFIAYKLRAQLETWRRGVLVALEGTRLHIYINASLPSEENSQQRIAAAPGMFKKPPKAVSSALLVLEQKQGAALGLVTFQGCPFHGEIA